MPAISPDSADSPRLAESADADPAPQKIEFGLPAWPELGNARAQTFSAPRQRKMRPPALWPQAARVLLRRLRLRLAVPFRGSAVYRLSLFGRIPRRIGFHPTDVRPRRLDDAAGYFQGRFRLAGATVQIRSGSIFDSDSPSAGFTRALQGFEWLRHLEAADSEAAADFSLKSAKAWLKRYARYRLPAWAPEIIATRLINIFAHGEFFIMRADPAWRKKFFRSLRDQIRMLTRTMEEASEGLPRLECACALMLAGFCLGQRRSVRQGWKRLHAELARQILADGGHVSRSPEVLLHAFRDVSMVTEAALAIPGQIPRELDAMLARMAGALRFLRLGDGALADFHGGCEADAASIAALIDRGAIKPPGAEAEIAGYRRLAAGRTVLVADTASPPPFAFSDKAHAGCLAFEMSVGGQRLIVNCGAAPDMDANWERSLRSTAAHSTLTLADYPQSGFLDGRYAGILGEKLVGSPVQVTGTSGEDARGRFIEASHDAYVAPFGIAHRRRMTISPRGSSLTGVDRLEYVGPRKRGAPLPFAIRFHIHPDIRVSLAQDGLSALLKLPQGEGWRFRWGNAALSLEDSVYLGGRPMRRAEQLVLTGAIGLDAVECAWLFEQVESA